MNQPINIRTVDVTRYIAPLREGGSLPALAEADDHFKYVLKFKGAGHGTKALIAEFIGGEIARVLRLKIPEIVFAQLDEAFGRTEGDEEIQELLRKSHGTNLGLHFLSGAVTFDPVLTKIDPLLASRIVWLDAYLTNIDRTCKNTNMLMWNKELWLIDHGAALYFHHAWSSWEKHAVNPFELIKDHVLLSQATQLADVDIEFRNLLGKDVLEAIPQLLPDEWLQWEGSDLTPEQIRKTYTSFLQKRLENSSIFINAANHARTTVI
ncbi:MAG: aminotransferase class I and II [Bacteroidota bacterium]|nr:aminotransferase class I and II [Bacteroidota bacterium]